MVKRKSRTIVLAILVDLSLMICEKIRPQGLFGSGEEDFYLNYSSGHSTSP